MLSGNTVRLFHASQVSVHHRVRREAPRNAHLAMFTNTPFTGDGGPPQIVGYGDIHDAFTLSLGGNTLFNAGSVGNPLDLPLACYAVLEGTYAGSSSAPWTVHIHRVPYDIEAEIAVAAASRMPDLDAYSQELRTAVYRGLTPRP